MDDNAVTQIVAAILAGHAAQANGNTHYTRYVDNYISVLKNLREKNDQVKEALGDKGTKLHGPI